MPPPLQSACVASCKNGDRFALVHSQAEHYFTLERDTKQPLSVAHFPKNSHIRQIVQLERDDAEPGDPEEFFIAGGYNAVRVRCGDGEEDVPSYSTLATFQRGCTCVAAGERVLATGGDDFRIVVKENSGVIGDVVAEFELTCPVSSLAVEPLDEDYLVASACDGKIRVFSVDEKTEVKVIEDLVPNLAASNSHTENETYYRRMAFQPVTAESLAICGAQGEAFFLNPMDDWDLTDRLQVATDASAKLTCLSWSHDEDPGKYLAFGDTKGCVSIFEVATKTLIKRETISSGHVIDVAFLRNSNLAVFACGSGGETKMVDLSKELGQSSTAKESQKPVIADTEVDANIFDDDIETNTIAFSDDEDEDDIGAPKAFSDAQAKREKPNCIEDSDDEMKIGDPVPEEPVQDMPNYDDDDDLVLAAEHEGRDDEDLFKSYADEDAMMQEKIEGTTAAARNVKSAPLPIVPLGPQLMSEPHESFQPGSTPSEKSEKYLCWNHVGKVRAIDGDSADDKSIEVEFHDTGTHHSVHLTNLENYKIGCLGRYGYALASQLDDFDEDEYDDPEVLENLSKNTKARLTVSMFKKPPELPHLFAKQWTTTMGRKVDIECITMNDCWVAAATSPDNIIHFWTIYGSCTYHPNLVIPGRILTVSSTDDGSQLIVLFEKTLGIHDTYNVGWMVYEATAIQSTNPVFKIHRRGHLPMEAKDSVHWCGFSTDTHEPFVVAQESGRVMQLNPSGQITELCQFLATRKRFDYYWVTEIEELRGEIGAVLCKGNKHPVRGEPVNHHFLSIYEKCSNLLCIENVGKDDLKELQRMYAELAHIAQLVNRGYNQLQPNKNRVMIKLFGQLTKLEGAEGRCYDIVRYCDDPTVIMKLGRLVGKQGKSSLENALYQLAEQKMEQQQLGEEDPSSSEDLEEPEPNLRPGRPTTPQATRSQPFGQNFSPVVRRVSDLDIDDPPQHPVDEYDENDELEEIENIETMEEECCEIEQEGDRAGTPVNAPINPFARNAQQQISTPKAGEKQPMNLLSKLAKDKTKVVLKERNQQDEVKAQPSKKRKLDSMQQKKKALNAASLFGKNTAPKTVASIGDKKKKTQSKLAMFARKK